MEKKNVELCEVLFQEGARSNQSKEGKSLSLAYILEKMPYGPIRTCTFSYNRSVNNRRKYVESWALGTAKHRWCEKLSRQKISDVLEELHKSV